MKKVLTIVAVSAFVGLLSFGSIASADDVIPGAYGQQDQSVMGVGQTMMQMGANTRVLTNATNLASQAGNSRRQMGVNSDYQFGSSQSEQSWKQWRSVEDAGVIGGPATSEAIAIAATLYSASERTLHLSLKPLANDLGTAATKVKYIAVFMYL